MRERNTQIKINLTKTEAAAFDLARGQVRRAIAGRLLILRQPCPRPIDPDIAQLSFELNKIGVNLNQIARVFNEKYPSDKTFNDARDLVYKLKGSLS
jgi:hypothetical protein